MKYAQIIFSPTGGTKAAAEAVTARWEPYPHGAPCT